MGEKYKPEQFIEALRATRGIQAQAARLIGCDRNTVMRYIREYPQVAQALEEARASVLDDAESVLVTKAIDEGDTTALMFLLRTVGRSRGYGHHETHEQAGVRTVRVIRDDHD